MEWTTSYVPLLCSETETKEMPQKWQIGVSGSKMYLHNFAEEVSYVLAEDLVFNLKTDIVVKPLEHQRCLIYFSTFCDSQFEDVV